MRLTTILLCEDVRREISRTNTIVGQFSALRGGLNEITSFKVFFGVTSFLGMARIGVIVKTPENDAVKKFVTDEIACLDRAEQYTGFFTVENLMMKTYGTYEIILTCNKKEIGRLRFKYSVPDVSNNRINISGKDVIVPRLDMKDPQELLNYSKLFIRRFSSLDTNFKSVKVISQFNPSDGIGSVSNLLVKEMINRGIKVNPICIYPGHKDIEFVNSLDKSNIVKNDTDITIVNALPPHMKNACDDKRVLLFTYWENSNVNEGWVNISNTADALFVPSSYVKNVYRNSGVNRPIYVYKQAIDDTFQYAKKVDSGYFTILFLGTCIPRKGIDLFTKACDKVFGGDEFVRFRIHVKPWAQQLGDVSTDLLKKYSSNKQYSITTHCASTNEIYEMMKGADTLFAPSRSEGLGLVPIQSLISGTPVLIPEHSGFLEYSDTPGVTLIKKHKLVKGSGIYAGGDWYEPDFDELCEKLKQVRENRLELLEAVKQGSSILRRDYASGNIYSSLQTTINGIYK